MSKKKLSGSSRRGSSRQASGGVWVGYDDNSMPELSGQQLASFRPVGAKERARFQAGVVRGPGRPRKPEGEKEVPVSMRFPPGMLRKLKAQARRRGCGWQTYAKSLIEKAL